MLSLDQALESVLGAIVPLEAESCDLSSSHLRVLAADMVASNDIPPFDNASMDGYAVSADDTRPVSGPGAIGLELQGEVGAGDSFASGIGAGKTVRILTGAMIPPGADAVIEQERVTVRDGRIRIEALVEKGRNIRRRGEDIRSGQTVLTKGSLVTSARVGVLASLGARSVPVFKTPRVAILTTGNELVDVDQPLEGGKIRDSNAYTLSALVRDAGCIPVMIGRAADSSSDLRTKLVAGLGCDALITSGGVSVGDRDLVLETLKQIGAEVRFWKVNIKPGMPFAFCLHL
ncbi:MAG TPA: molybdopterin molybdotransferase MoeA, partial [Bacteroidota bacterium]|nr:molybdopterin molybdotransferase MoeA [Bacteroidota bacterium]